MSWSKRLVISRIEHLGRETFLQQIDGAHPKWRFAWWRAVWWRWVLTKLSAAETFSLIYEQNLWGIEESRSGIGSTLAETETLRSQLPALLRQLEVGSLLDLPCGDFHWMSQVNLSGINYIGADIVPELIAANEKIHAAAGRQFTKLDVVTGTLPQVDAVLCRDCLVHLPHEMVLAALANIRTSGSRWLISTTFPGQMENQNIPLGLWRPINLERPPFSLPTPKMLIKEGTPDARYAEKCLGVWLLADI